MIIQMGERKYVGKKLPTCYLHEYLDGPSSQIVWTPAHLLIVQFVFVGFLSKTCKGVIRSLDVVAKKADLALLVDSVMMLRTDFK